MTTRYIRNGDTFYLYARWPDSTSTSIKTTYGAFKWLNQIWGLDIGAEQLETLESELAFGKWPDDQQALIRKIANLIRKRGAVSLYPAPTKRV